jgi:hypothetical protein
MAARRHLVEIEGRKVAITIPDKPMYPSGFPLPGRGLYGGSKIAPQFLVEVLAKGIGQRGVAREFQFSRQPLKGAGVYADRVVNR